MVKYSYELKQQVIQDYLDGLGGYKTLAKKYHLPTKSIILQWLNIYEHYGFEGLKIKRKKRTYSREFKLYAIECYVTKALSYREIANQLDIDAPALLTAWVLKYKKYGTNSFKNEGKRGNITPMPKVQPSEVQNQRIRELEIQLRKAQIEVDCLKELRRLREAKLIKKKLK